MGNNREVMALGHDFPRVLALLTRGEVHRRSTLLELPKINPKPARKWRRGPSSAQNGPQADPRRSLEVGQERVHVHVRQFVWLGIRTTGTVHTVAIAIGGWRSGC